MIKVATLVEDYEYVSQRDDAMDSEAPDFEERWGHYTNGVGPIPVKEGAQPSVFKLRHIRGVQQAGFSEWLSKAVGNDALWQRACFEAARIALVGCSNVKAADGSDLELKRQRIDGVLRVSDETTERIPFEIMVELGAVAIRKMTPSPS